MSQRNSRRSPFRHWSALVMLIGGFVALALQAANLQWQQGEFLQERGEARAVRTHAVVPSRGRILDRNGELLAVSTPVDSITAEPRVLCAKPEHWSRLGDALGDEPGRISKLCETRGNREFAYLKRHLSPADAAVVLGLGIPGVESRREYRRYYPMGPVAAHVVGFTDRDNVGIEGLERQFDAVLAGKPGINRTVRDSRGRVVERIQRIEAVEHGRDLHISLDARLQFATRRALAASVAEHNAAGGSAVLLDSHSGEVLAMVNLPDYNPNRLDRGDSATRRNRAVTDLIEPGSTIKPFTVAMALQSGQFQADTIIETSPGKHRIGGHVISDIKDYGSLTVSRVIAKSSNIGSAKIAMSFPASRLYETLSEVGFGRATGIELPGERLGELRDRGSWKPIEHATLSFGYGLSATPLQIAQAYSVLANDGLMVPVTIHRRARPVAGERILSRPVARSVNGMLEVAVSPDGSARRARVDRYRAAGKTGTSRKLIDGRYAKDRYVSSFAGFAPASNPRFVMAVVVDDPRHERYYGGYVAAPVFAQVVSEALRLYDVAPDDLELQGLQLVLREEGVN